MVLEKTLESPLDCKDPLLIATGEATPLRGLEGVPGLPGAPQGESGLIKIQIKSKKKRNENILRGLLSDQACVTFLGAQKLDSGPAETPGEDGSVNEPP